MKYRKLRIAWSVGCGFACVLLIALWVRSYAWRDRASIPLRATRFLRIDSSHGKFEFETYGQGMGETWFSVTTVSHADISNAWREFTASPSPKMGSSGVGNIQDGAIFCLHPALVRHNSCRHIRHSAMAWLALHPPYSANRHDADRGGAGAGGLRGEEIIPRPRT